MSEPEIPAPPEPLAPGGPGREMWDAVWTEWGEFIPTDVRLLASACAVLDRIRALETALTDQPLIVPGSYKQPVTNPLVASIKEHRALFASLVRQLALDTGDDESGRVPSRSEQAAHAARARWGTRSAGAAR